MSVLVHRSVEIVQFDRQRIKPSLLERQLNTLNGFEYQQVLALRKRIPACQSKNNCDGIIPQNEIAQK
jgi:hypothetical protein